MGSYDPLQTLFIWGVNVIMLVQMILCFLHGEDHMPPANTREIDHWINDMKKVNTKQITNEDKIVHFH